jgi:hypothetical protein
LTTLRSGQLELQIEGRGIVSSELKLYNLSGQLVLDAQGAGNRLSVATLDRNGRPLANGVYLYTVTVRGFDGKVIQSEVKKLVLLR